MSELNDPRVFFSAERTALAWNRTALTLMAFGFAIERFGLSMQILEHTEKTPKPDGAFWFGLVFMLLGIFFSLAAAAQYKRVLKTLKPVEIPKHASPNLAFMLNIVIAVLATALIGYMVATDLLPAYS